jgi:deazaflavin-dependent oxidoreductase (nitroreductase family)
LLTHFGRKTGLPHETVLQVVHHDRATGSYIVASGWGEKSDWFQNIMVKPKVMVESGRNSFVAIASRLSVTAAEQALLEYARKHPFPFRELAGLVLGKRRGELKETCHLLAQSVPLIYLEPDHLR